MKEVCGTASRLLSAVDGNPTQNSVVNPGGVTGVYYKPYYLTTLKGGKFTNITAEFKFSAYTVPPNSLQIQAGQMDPWSLASQLTVQIKRNYNNVCVQQPAMPWLSLCNAPIPNYVSFGSSGSFTDPDSGNSGAISTNGTIPYAQQMLVNDEPEVIIRTASNGKTVLYGCVTLPTISVEAYEVDFYFRINIQGLFLPLKIYFTAFN